MTQRQSAKIAMHNTVLNLLIENEALWLNIDAFQDTANNYRSKLNTINDVAKGKARKLAGVNDHKLNTKLKLSLLSIKYAGLLRAYASKTGNLELKAEMTFSRSELIRIADNKLTPVATSIYDNLAKYKTDMVKYSVTEEHIISYFKFIEDYKLTSTSMHKAIMSRKTLGLRLSTLLAELASFQENELDQVMQFFETDHPEFHQNYLNCSLIVDPKTSPTQFAGIITDAATGAVLKNVLVTVQDTNFISNADKVGNYKLRIPKPGTYTVSFELLGYETTQAEGELKLGKTTEMNVTMKKIM